MFGALAIYLGVGVVAGILAGLLGVGGGLVVVPALIIAFNLQGIPDTVLMHLAVGTSLATIVFTSIASIRAHHKRGAVLWRLFIQLTPGIVVGALLGAAVAGLLPGAELRMVFGIYAITVALQMGLDLKPSPNRQLPGFLGMGLVGTLIGTVSAVVGIGGGSMTVPFLAWCNVEVRKAVATSAACGLPIAVAGAAGFVVSGWQVADLPEYSSGYLYWPALVGITAASTLFAGFGAKLAHSLPARTLKRVFAVFLLGIGLHLLLS